MVDLEIYSEKIAKSGLRIIERATEEAHSRAHKEIIPDHILKAIAELERPLFNEAIQRLNLDPTVVMEALESRLARGKRVEGEIKISDEVRNVLSTALKHAHERNRRLIESTDLFAALYKGKRNFIAKLIRSRRSFFSRVLKQLGFKQPH